MKKKTFQPHPGWENDSEYELKYLRLENQRLKEENDKKISNKDVKVEDKDIIVLLDVAMSMKNLLEICRSQLMMPIELAREIDRVIKKIENYG